MSYRSTSSAGGSPAAFAGSASNRISAPSFKFPPTPEVQEEQQLFNSRMNALPLNRHSAQIFAPNGVAKIENGRNEISAPLNVAKPPPALRSPVISHQPPPALQAPPPLQSTYGLRSPVISHQRASSLTNALNGGGTGQPATLSPNEISFTSTTSNNTNQLLKKVIFHFSFLFRDFFRSGFLLLLRNLMFLLGAWSRTLFTFIFFGFAHL